MANFRSANLTQGQPLGATAATIQLTADDQFINPFQIPGGVPASLLHLQSDSAVAADRTFTLASGQFMGQQLNIVFESGSSLTCQLLNTGNVQLTSNWVPVQWGTLSLEWNGTYWVEVGRTPVSGVITGTLTQANILAMNGTAVELMAAPAAGTAIIVDEIELFHEYSTAAYADGGDVTIEYADGTDVMVIDVAFVTAGADGRTLVKPNVYTSSASTTGFDLAATAGQGIEITNATGAFTAGNAANVINWRIRYHLVTVLT